MIETGMGPIVPYPKYSKALRHAAGIVGKCGIDDPFDDQAGSESGNKGIDLQFGDDQSIYQSDQ